MKVELIPFQKLANQKLINSCFLAVNEYRLSENPQIISFTAPTGAGKTIIMASLVESILYGNESFAPQEDAIFVWLSDSPELNEQSRLKFQKYADKLRPYQLVTIKDDTFDSDCLDDGIVYFLNTQKLGKSSNLTKHADGRQHTIWETLQNTIIEKGTRLYFIIDEAHRGAQGNAAAKATTIMQKFIKGSAEDGLSPMPLVIGMTATIARFNNLAANTNSTTRSVVITPDEVRASGLLKDRIIITYPEESLMNKDMAILQAATDDWVEKWQHWNQYCFEQHYKYINPVFVIQVLNNTGDGISDTPLDECLKKIEERADLEFQPGEVVHTFGQTTSTLTINGLRVPYLEPSRIAEERNVKVVFFKENLSTGWDCPRAETMMSFRSARDATYIAQLLGRMVRTPMQMHIQVDEVLNDVHLFLPHFDKRTVNDVVKYLQESEGGEIPTEVVGQSYGEDVFETVSVDSTRTEQHTDWNRPAAVQTPTTVARPVPQVPGQNSIFEPVAETVGMPLGQNPVTIISPSAHISHIPANEPAEESNKINRREIVDAINNSGLLTYKIRNVRINNYLTSLYSLARLLTQSGLYSMASEDIIDEIVDMIHQYVIELKEDNRYNGLAARITEFKLLNQVFDAFGEKLDNSGENTLFSTTDTDIDRQFRAAEAKLGNEGVGSAYGRKYYDSVRPEGYKIDVILYAADSECFEKLHSWAEHRFHDLNDSYRRNTVSMNDRLKKQYERLVSDGDEVSKHNLDLPYELQWRRSDTGRLYDNHLYVNSTGSVRIELNGWEDAIIREEASRDDFVCWLRNLPRASWAICIPYEKDGRLSGAYPDFLIVRKDGFSNYVVDLLEPHDPTRVDNLSKAQGFAKYAEDNPGIGRIQLIRTARDVSANIRFKRLDMSRSEIRDKVKLARTNEDLDHLFDDYGIFED